MSQPLLIKIDDTTIKQAVGGEIFVNGLSGVGNIPANTMLGNNTAVPAVPLALTRTQILEFLKAKDTWFSNTAQAAVASGSAVGGFETWLEGGAGYVNKFRAAYKHSTVNNHLKFSAMFSDNGGGNAQVQLTVGALPAVSDNTSSIGLVPLNLSVDVHTLVDGTIYEVFVAMKENGGGQAKLKYPIFQVN